MKIFYMLILSINQIIVLICYLKAIDKETKLIYTLILYLLLTGVCIIGALG